MRRTRVGARLLGLQRAVVEDVQIGSEEEIVVAATRLTGDRLNAYHFSDSRDRPEFRD